MPRKPGGNSPRSRQRTLSAERRKMAFQLRMAGRSYAEIGEALGIVKSNVFYHINEELKEMARETREDALALRELETARLDKALSVIWPDVLAGDLRAVDRYLAISKRMGDLWGLDQPKELRVGASADAKPLTIKINVVKKDGTDGPADASGG